MNLDPNSESTDLLSTIREIGNEIQKTQPEGADANYLSGQKAAPTVFVPIEPQSMEEAGLTESDVEAIILKFLHAYGPQLGRHIASHVKLPFGIIKGVLNQLKNQILVTYKNLAAANDYEYELTDPGQARARQLTEICSYCGAAPVGFDKYVESVKAQSLRHHRLSPKECDNAFSDLLLSRESLAQLGQAVNSGRSIFLYGKSGNGKSSVASRCINAYDSGVWIPRTLTIGGEIIRLYDPSTHEELPHRQDDSLLKKSVVDDRWIRIKRPKVIVGGELTQSQMDISKNRFTGILEAPVHMKSNNGCLVIDDFGRQTVTTTELLNRWIIPLERGTDYVTLPNGRKIESPFDQMLIFSTNVERESLCDDAFFRRIAYKIEMAGPSESQFSKLFHLEAERAGFEMTTDIADYLIQTLQQNNQSLKFSFVFDILTQCAEFCEFHGKKRTLTKALIDLSIHNYFADF